VKVKPYLTEIKEWCLTMTETQICKRLGIGKTAWYEYKKEYTELSDIIKKGRQDLVTELRSALIRKAKGYRYSETKEVEEYNKLPVDMIDVLLSAGYSKESIRDTKSVRKEVVLKEMSPDVAALNLALKNYDKENWANDPQMLDIRKKELKLQERKIDESSW